MHKLYIEFLFFFVSDVLVAMYRVPANARLGTWMMKVKATPEGCAPKRKINVHVQVRIPLNFIQFDEQ